MHLKSVTLQAEKYPTREHYPFDLPIFHLTKCVPFPTPVS